MTLSEKTRFKSLHFFFFCKQYILRNTLKKRFVRTHYRYIKFSYLTFSMCRSGAARSSSAAMASSASLDVLLNVGSVRSRPRGVKAPDRLVHSFSSDISRANLRPADCHSVMRLSYSCGKSKYQSWRREYRCLSALRRCYRDPSKCP